MSITLIDRRNSYGSTRYPSMSFSDVQAGDLLVMVLLSWSPLSSTSYKIVHSYNQGSLYVNVITRLAESSSSYSINATMNASSACYRIGYCIRGAMALKHEFENCISYTGNTFSTSVSKPSSSTPMIWFVASDYGLYDTSISYSASPDDMTYTRSRPSGYHLSLSSWFDDGSGAQSHTISYPLNCSSYPFIIGGLSIVPEENRYLISDQGTNYTVQNNALVSLGSGTINTNYMIENGFSSQSLPVVADLISTLYEPTIYDWALDVNVHPSNHNATITGVPNPIEITSNPQPLYGVTGVTSITSVYTGTPKISLKFDSGNWIYYDTTQNDWVNTDSTHLGMDVTTFEGLTTEWTSVLSGATQLQVKVSIASTDSFTSLTIKFQKA